MTPTLGNIDWHRFLARARLPAATATVLASFSGQPILVTGAGGSIGSALASKLASAGARLILLDSSENTLFELQTEFAASGSVAQFYLGSISDRGLLHEIFTRHRPRIVFHAAAFKHVPLLEEQPFAAIANNVLSTQILDAAASSHHAHIILLSTDKAVEPASVMGATKRVAEQIVLTAGGTVLRLANVLGSRGSVAEVFANQIAAGVPLTVTDPAARRYFLTKSEAVDLLLAAAAEPNPSTLFIPDLHATHFISDLARFMAHTLAPGRDVPIEFTQLRAGDKETEILLSSREIPRAPDAHGLISVDSPTLPSTQLHDLLERLKFAVECRDLAAALSTLRRLVTDYEPSPAIRSMLTAILPPVHNA